ncbi:MAG: HAMP domain-containing sensor histidine kinase [Lacunisphaera sp.]
MTDKTLEQLTALSAHLAARREAILQAWHDAADADPAQTTVSFLTRAQFNDHIPPLLDAFERKLRARPGGARAAAADDAKTQEDVKHGLQRWQQGYRLGELMHEWGHLHRCLAEEVHAFVATHPEIERDTLAAAHQELIALISEGINESASEYARMQQAEAAGRVRDLQLALEKGAEVELRRAQLIHQAVHDLRTNVQSVGSAADVLGETNIAESERVEFAKMIQQGVESLSAMLGDLMALARLEAGQEKREIASFDAAKTLAELCTMNQPVAAGRNLFLKIEGPALLPVEGDAGKLRRLVQNLLVNALKYTVEGGVTIGWGEEDENWWVIVKDTGPGLRPGPSAPIAAGMKEATDSAREADEKAAAAVGDAPAVLPLPPGDPAPAPRRGQQPGEGIGLSIVKRLCELLDASLEMVSSATTGTTFRVVFPRSYRRVDY